MSKIKLYIRVEKHKKGDYRLMIIPKELIEGDFSMCCSLLEKDKNVVKG